MTELDNRCRVSETINLKVNINYEIIREKVQKVGFVIYVEPDGLVKGGT